MGGALLLGAPILALAQDEPPEPARRAWNISADSISYERERDVYTARGNVRIVQPGRSLRADWLAFSNTTRRGVATGNVVIEDEGQQLEADVIHFELDDLRGILLDGRLEGKQTGFLATGEEVRKLSDQEYEFEKGTFTTCRCPDGGREPWVLRSEEAELEIGGYGTARNTVLDVLGVPVFWLPWIRYPLLTERATGLLFPVLGTSSRSGFEIGLPFFWAALPNLNVTLTPHWLSERGFKPEAAVEYVFGERSYGELLASGILDDRKVLDDDPSTSSDDRYGVAWLHDQELPAGWRWKADGLVFSDNNYPFDFREFSRYESDRFAESTTFVEKRFGALDRYGFVAAARYAQDLQNPDGFDRDRFLLQRAGALALSGAPQRVIEEAPFDVSFDTQLVNFYPSQNAEKYYAPDGVVVANGRFLDTGIDGVPDGREPDRQGNVVPGDPHEDDFSAANPSGTEMNGRFEDGEPLVERGQRVILNPRVALPLRLDDRFELRSELGYHGTFYETKGESFESRNLGTAQVALSTRLRRALELPFGAGRATHLLEPTLSWIGITNVSQDENPLLVPRSVVLQDRLRQLELGNVLRDEADRIAEANAVTLALGNRLFVPTPTGADGVLEPPRLFADVTFSAAWNFAGSELRDLYLDGVVFPAPQFRSSFIAGWDLDDSDFSEALFEFGYADAVGNDLGIGYRYVRDVPTLFGDWPFDDRFDRFEENFDRINQIDLFGRYAFTRLWALSYRLRFSFEDTVALTNQLGVEYTSRCQCWAVQLGAEYDRSGGIDVALRYRILGLGDDTVRPFGAQRRGRDGLLPGG